MSGAGSESSSLLSSTIGAIAGRAGGENDWRDCGEGRGELSSSARVVIIVIIIDD